jgi:hypothetical protein
VVAVIIARSERQAGNRVIGILSLLKWANAPSASGTLEIQAGADQTGNSVMMAKTATALPSQPASCGMAARNDKPYADVMHD